jgi:hypothetical protein
MTNRPVSELKQEISELRSEVKGLIEAVRSQQNSIDQQTETMKTPLLEGAIPQTMITEDFNRGRNAD